MSITDVCMTYGNSMLSYHLHRNARTDIIPGNFHNIDLLYSYISLRKAKYQGRYKCDCKITTITYRRLSTLGYGEGESLESELGKLLSSKCEVTYIHTGFVLIWRNVSCNLTSWRQCLGRRQPSSSRLTNCCKLRTRSNHLLILCNVFLSIIVPSHTLSGSACHKRRSIRSHWLTTCYRLHHKTSLVSIQPHSSAHTETPAHNALHCQVGLASGRSLGGDWRRRPGCPRARWTDQSCNNTGSVPANLWRQAMVEWCDGPSWLRDDEDDECWCCWLQRLDIGLEKSTAIILKSLPWGLT